ncbi:MAG TPA: hypothetical protein VIY48_09530 [Candidatus Paceibacterota bacterium]
MEKPDSELNGIEYLEKKQQEIITRIEVLAQTGKNDDAVKLKANSVLLNKIMPDRTKMDVDVRSNAPYDMLRKALGETK